MSLQDDYAAAQDPRVVAQVTAAIYAAAANIYSEASTVTNHASRAAFATKIATGQQNLSPLILSAASFAGLTAASTDTTVSNAVAALWSMWAQA
jgi:hypothetical protein